MPLIISYLTALLLDIKDRAVIAIALAKTWCSDTLPLLNIFRHIFELGAASTVSV